MEDACFSYISAVFSKGARVESVTFSEALINNRQHYVTTFELSGPLPSWYRERVASCYFDKSTKRFITDDTRNPNVRVYQIRKNLKDPQEQFKVNRYNSMRPR